MTVKKEMSPDTVIKLRFDPSDTADVVYQRFNAKVQEVKNVLEDTSFGALAGAFLAPFLYGLYWKRTTRAACWVSFVFSTVFMLANIFVGSSFPALLQSPINAGAFCMLAGLVLVPVVSLLTRPPRPDHIARVFSCYDRKVVVSVKDSIGDQTQT